MISRRRSLKARRRVVDLAVHIDHEVGGNRGSISPTRISPIRSISPSQEQPVSAQSVKKGKKTPTLKPLDTQSNGLRQIVTPSSAHPLSAGSDQHFVSGGAGGPYQHEPAEILPFLFLGSEKNASSKELLMRKNIRYILNVGKECKNHFEVVHSSSASFTNHTNNSGTDVSVDSFPLSPLYNPLNLNNPHSAPLDVGYYGSNEFARPQKRMSMESLKYQRSSDMESIGSEPQRNEPESIVRLTESLADEFNKQAQIKTPSSSKSSTTVSEIEYAFVSQFGNSVEQKLYNNPQLDVSHFETPKYLKFPWTHNEENMVSYFEKAFQFIDEARRNEQGVLVHCKQGVSRSATLVTAYIMKTMHISMNEAYAIVKKASPTVSPNLGLIYQLLEFEKTLGIECDNVGVDNDDTNSDTNDAHLSNCIKGNLDTVVE